MKLKIDYSRLVNLAKKYQTPCYVYDKTEILTNYDLYKQSFAKYNNKFLICYAVKASSNLAILNILAKNDSGFDIVSLGELKRVLKAGGNASKIVFSGVGKQDFEIKEALDANILCFNIESEAELILINNIAKQLNKKAPISIRINPNIDAKSHPYISTGLKEHKFGIDISNAEYIYNLANDLSNIIIQGIDCHIGSQLTDIKPLEQACIAVANLTNQLNKNKNINISHINMGGGLGINYNHVDLKDSENFPGPKLWIDTIFKNLNPDNNTTILIEPGRSIIGSAGILLTTVIYNKFDLPSNNNFTIVDAGMNDLLRPALYGAKHEVINLSDITVNAANFNSIPTLVSIAGPVCESSDVFAKKINLVSKPGDILAILDAGAYGFSMSSNYNSRPNVPEILFDNTNDYLIRKRQTIEDLYANETIIH